jgi:sugar-phosphatase
MHKAIEAVIFDMDGVLIDSEPLWRRAMIKGFGENGIFITESECRKTTGQRLKEVVTFWLDYHKISSNLVDKVEADIVKDLIDLINKEGQPIQGVNEIIELCNELNLKVGLATSSSIKIMDAVLNKLQIKHQFHAILSAQDLRHGKPHPEVFINCAHFIGVNPNACLAIEDSVNGVIAAKAAQMRVIAVPDEEHKTLKQFAVADYFCHQLLEAEKIIRSLC